MQKMSSSILTKNTQQMSDYHSIAFYTSKWLLINVERKGDHVFHVLQTIEMFLSSTYGILMDK